jgi:predicted RNase H-like HicB family nuclease
MSGKLSVIIEKDDFGYFAYCPELKGCQTQGETFEEANANIKEAIELYLETLEPAETTLLLSKDIFTTSYEVAFA